MHLLGQLAKVSELLTVKEDQGKHISIANDNLKGIEATY